MSSLQRTAGELLIDHTNSPGIPPELAAKWSSMGVAVAPGSTRLETSTYTCKHCNSVVILRPERTRAREVCRKCMAVVCDRCIDNCIPFDLIAERVLGGHELRIDERTNLLLPPAIRSI